MNGDEGRMAIAQAPGAHPGEEVLAAYAERALDAQERHGVERHLVTCGECRDTIAQAVALAALDQPTVSSTRSFRSRRAAMLVKGALAAAAAVALVVWYAPWRPGSTADPLDQLIAAYAAEPTRIAQGRLSPPFRYAPAPAETRGARGPDLSPDVRIAIGRIEDAAKDDATPRTLWSVGLARLAARDVDGAIASLESARAAGAASAELNSDLAAAYLALGRRSGDASDFTRALDAADRALSRNPTLPSALFNRALALDALQRPDAGEAWRMFIAQDGGGPWTAEARARLETGN